MWIVFRLELAQFVQAPWFVTIDGLKRLVAFALGVIHIRLWLTIGLAGVPDSPVLLGPRLCRVRQARPFRNFAEEDPIDTKLIYLIAYTIRRAHHTGAGDDLQQMVFFAVRVGGGVGRYGLHAGSRVAFVPEIGGGCECGVLGYILVEKIIERAFCCGVILQCHDTGDGSLGARTFGEGSSRYNGV